MDCIYALRCPVSGQVRYIGKTRDAARRMRDHLREARLGARHHRAKWLRILMAQGLIPTFELIYAVPDGEIWQDAETRLIAEYRAAGHPLTNGTRAVTG